MQNPVVVGVDGSAESLAAARYGAALAQRRNRPLTLAHGYLYPMGHGSAGLTAYAPALPDPRADAQNMLNAAGAAILEEFPGLKVHTVQVAASGPVAMIELSATADTVVVGHRGRGGFPELLLGSVGAQVAAHGRGPVVVFRPNTNAAPDAPVVVGVDDSPQSGAVLAFAFEEAAGRHVPLAAIHVYAPVFDGAAAAAEGLLDAALEPWTAKYPDVLVRREVRAVDALDKTALRRQAGPADNAEGVLVDAARHAALVVVGSRGRGGFAGLLLGSVSQALVHHAPCPVAVVHAHVPAPAAAPR